MILTLSERQLRALEQLARFKPRMFEPLAMTEVIDLLEQFEAARARATAGRVEPTICPECGRWNYHLARCSHRRAEPVMPSKPTIGRIVHYREEDADLKAPDESYRPCRAAIVVAIHDDGAELYVFPTRAAGGGPTVPIKEGTGAGEWHWPERGLSAGPWPVVEG